MTANIFPIMSRIGDLQWGTITTANTAKDGTGTVVTVFAADATYGGYVKGLIWMPLGTNIASVGRCFLNNNSTNATAANNSMIGQISLPATTNTETAGLPPFYMPIGLALPANYKLNIVIGTTVSAGYQVTAVGGKY